MLGSDDERRKAIETFFSALYEAKGPRHDIDLESKATDKEMDMLTRKITPNRIRKCVGQLKKHKTCDETDGLVADMLHDAPEDMFYAIALAFEDRVRRGPAAGEDLGRIRRYTSKKRPTRTEQVNSGASLSSTPCANSTS